MNLKSILGVLALLTIMVSAAPLVYERSYTPNCGGLGEPICEATYEIINQDPISLSTKAEDVTFKYKTETDQELKTSIPYLRNSKVLYSIDNKEYTDDFKTIENIEAGKSYFIKLIAEKVWQPTENEGEYYLPNVDQVLSAFGTDYVQWAWWNSTYPYKRLYNFTGYGNSVGSIGVFNLNLSQSFAENKVDAFGHCLKFSDYSETYEIYGLNKYSVPLNQTNATVFLLNLTVVNGNNAIWLYYGQTNPSTCSINMANKLNAAAASGLVRANLFLNDTYNQSNFIDSANPSYNFSRVGVRLTRNMSLGFNGDFTLTPKTNITSVNTGFNNLAAGTVITYVNISSWVNTALVTRGYVVGTNRDFSMATTTNVVLCSMNATASALNTTPLVTNTPYVVSCDWNGTAQRMFVDGILNTSTTTTNTLPNSAGRPIGIAGFADYDASQFDGKMSFILFFNRTLNASEHRLIADFNKGFVGVEELENSLLSYIRAYDLLTGEQVYFNGTIVNSTTSYTIPQGLSFSAATSLLPQGLSTTTVQNASYYPSQITEILTNQSLNYTLYLNPKSNPNIIFVRFHVVESGYSPITNAYIFIQYVSGGTYTVTSCLTDSTGTCGVYLDSSKTFLITASATGYSSSITSIQPTGQDYTISLTSTSGLINYIPTYYGVSYQLSPAILNAISNWTIINYTVRDSTSQLISYGLNLTYNGVLIFNQTNTTPSFGGTILVNLSTEGKVGNLTAIFHFRKANQSSVIQTYSYTIYQNLTMENWSLSSAMGRIREDGKSPFMVLIVIIMVIAMAIAWLNRSMAMGAGTGFIAVLLLFFAFPLAKASFNASEVLLLVFLLIIAFGLFRLRSGQ